MPGTSRSTCPNGIHTAGFHRARRFVSIEGSPRYFTLFEADLFGLGADAVHQAEIAGAGERVGGVRLEQGEVAGRTLDGNEAAGAMEPRGIDPFGHVLLDVPGIREILGFRQDVDP